MYLNYDWKSKLFAAAAKVAFRRAGQFWGWTKVSGMKAQRYPRVCLASGEVHIVLICPTPPCVQSCGGWKATRLTLMVRSIPLHFRLKPALKCWATAQALLPQMCRISTAEQACGLSICSQEGSPVQPDH